MTKSTFITLLFVSLTLLVLGSLWYFSGQTSVPEQDTYTNLPRIELTDAKTQTDFTEVVEADSAEHEAVMNAIYTDEYYYFTCIQNNEESRTLILVSKYVDENGVNTFEPSRKAFSNFESRLLEDWSEVLLPNVTTNNIGELKFTTRLLNNPHIVATEYRIGETADKSYKVYYGWVLNYIIAATNENCLFKTMEDLYGVH